MKKNWLGIRIALSICVAFGWWGLLYPQLALTPDTVVIKAEAEDGHLQDMPLEWDFDGSLYRDLLEAEPGRITFRSRFLTDMRLFLEAFENGDK